MAVIVARNSCRVSAILLKSNSSGVSYQNELVRIGLQNIRLRHDALNGVPNSRLWGIGPFLRVFDPVPP